MKHLTETEMIGFACIRKYDDDAKRLAKHVNSHILICRECAEKLKKTFALCDTLNVMNGEEFSLHDFECMSCEVTAEEIEKEQGISPEEEYER